MSIKRDYKSFDFFLAAMVILLALAGLVLIASSTGFKPGASINDHKELRGQAIWVVTGIAIMIAMAFVDYQFICKFYIPIYIVNLGLLLIVLVLKYVMGENVFRSIILPFDLGSVQPSEFNKIFMIIFLARYIDNNKQRINKLWVLGSVLALTAVPVLLVQQQPSLSASLVTVFLMCTMLFVSKIKYKYIIIALAVIVPVVVFVFYDLNREEPLLVNKIFFGHQLERMTTFLNPEEGSSEYYQTEQAVKAIGAGQLQGKGLFNHIAVVPESSNDFIFTILGEEFGFVGCITALLLMFIVIGRCILIASRSDVYYGKLIAAGVSGMFAFQVFAHVAVNTDLMPNTGIAFPFLSSGGSSLWVSMASVGLVINIGMTKSKSMFED